MRQGRSPGELAEPQLLADRHEREDGVTSDERAELAGCAREHAAAAGA